MDDEAEANLKGVSFSPNKRKGGSDGIDQWQETDHGGDIQTMQFGDDMPNDGGGGGGGDDGDLFSRWLMNAPTDANKYRPVAVDRRCLTQLRSSEVFIVRFVRACCTYCSSANQTHVICSFDAPVPQAAVSREDLFLSTLSHLYFVCLISTAGGKGRDYATSIIKT
jgi:hypothetical protein